ncbi:unnamed protein product [Brassica oleracea]
MPKQHIQAQKMRVAQSQPLSTTMMKHETQKRDAWKKIGHATNSTETASGPSPESHRKHEPSPEFNDIKSSPDHPIHLTTGNYRELTTTTEKPPPTTVLEATIHDNETSHSSSTRE